MCTHPRDDLKYHFVWVTKYRKRILTGAVGVRVRELVREVCRTHDIEILLGAVSADHVHVLLSCPPGLSPSKIVQYIKGENSRKLMMELQAYPETVLGAGGCRSFQNILLPLVSPKPLAYPSQAALSLRFAVERKGKRK